MRIKLFKFCCFISLFACFLPTVFANQVNLMQAYELTLKNSAKWAAQQVRAAAKQTTSQATRSQLLPQVAGDIQWSRIDYSGQSVSFDLDLDRIEGCIDELVGVTVETLSIGAGFDQLDCLFKTDVEPFTSTRYGLRFSQPLFRMDRWHQHQRGKHLRKQAQAELEKARQDLLLDVATAYFNVLKAKEALFVLKNEQEALAYSLKLTEKRYEKGLAKSAQVFEAQARFDAGLTNLLSAENAVLQTLGLLSGLTHQKNIDTTDLPGPINLQAPRPNEPERWVEMAMQNSPELTMAEFGHQMAKANHAAKSAARLPTIDFIASISTTDAGGATPVLDSGTNTSTTLGINLQVPLFTSGGLSAAENRAAYQKQAARWEANHAKHSLEQQVLSQFTTVSLSVKRGQAQARAVHSSEKAYKAVESGFKAGTHSLNELLQAQRAVYLSQRDAAESGYDYVLAVLKLKRLAGTIDTQDLEVLNAWLPTK